MPRSKIAGSHLRRAVGVHARRAAGEDDALGRQLANARGRDVVPHDFAVDMLLAHPAGDELGVLRAEVENEHALGSEIVLLHRAEVAIIALVGRVKLRLWRSLRAVNQWRVVRYAACVYALGVTLQTVRMSRLESLIPRPAVAALCRCKFF